MNSIFQVVTPNWSLLKKPSQARHNNDALVSYGKTTLSNVAIEFIQTMESHNKYNQQFESTLTGAALIGLISCLVWLGFDAAHLPVTRSLFNQPNQVMKSFDANQGQ